MTQLSEPELVDNCRLGKRTAQYELYRRYSRAMYGTCLRMCGNREDAEDLLQSSFADVFGKLSYFRGDSTIGAWIKRIVINNCLNHLKSKRLHFSDLEDHHSFIGVTDHDNEPEPPFSVETIKQAIQELPEGYRTVLNLYLLEGFDHAEIGEVLGISEQTSKSQYSRARKKLRELLKEIYNHETE